jgi:hypothetical protein
MELSPEGLFLHLWRVNRAEERVYPCLVKPQGAVESRLYATLSSSRSDYRQMTLDTFLDHLAAGDFDQVGRIRMKPRAGRTSAAGFSVRHAQRSGELERELLRRRPDR